MSKVGGGGGGGGLSFHEVRGISDYYYTEYIRHRVLVFNMFFLTTSNFGGFSPPPPYQKVEGGSSPPAPPQVLYLWASIGVRAVMYT